MIKVKVREGEPVDRALKRLKKSLKDEGVLDAVRQRRYFTPKSEKRKKAKQVTSSAQQCLSSFGNKKRKIKDKKDK